MHSENRCCRWVSIIWFFLTFCYIVSIGVPLTIIISCLFAVPVLLFNVLLFGIMRIHNYQKRSVIMSAILSESLAIIWWFVNSVIILSIRPNSLSWMNMIEVLYFYLMAWFFVTLPLNSIYYNGLVILCNPLVLILIIVLFLIGACIIGIIWWFFLPIRIMYWCYRRIIRYVVYDNFNRLDWIIWTEPILISGKTPAKLPWEHLFHHECITLWLRHQNTCPIDRTRVQSINQVIRL